MLQLIPYADASPALLASLTQHIDTAFGHIAFVQQHRWAIPDWVVLLAGHEEVYDSNIMLLARENHEKKYPATIDLNGLPW
jgi:hypothetical protein